MLVFTAKGCEIQFIMAEIKKRRHHYVPSGLSLNFCLGSKRLYLYDTKEVIIAPTSPKDVFRIKDFHSIVKGDGSIDHNMIEDQMMKFEASGCKAIGQIIEGKELTDNRKGWIACLWALQLLRTPFIRGGVETSLKELVRATSRVLDAQGQFGDMPESLKQFGNNFSELLDNGAVDVEISLPQVTMMSLVAWPDATDLFQNMNWCLLESGDENYFLLSDNPCAIVDPDFDKHNMGVGIGNKNVEVSLPIGKNHCLIASWNKIPSRMKATSRIVKAVNQRTALFGERFFVYPVQTKKIMNFLKPYSDVMPKMDAQSIPTQEGDKSGYFTVSRQNIFDEPRPRALYKALPLIFPEALV